MNNDQALHPVLRVQAHRRVVAVRLCQPGLHPAARFAHMAAEHFVAVAADQRLGAHAKQALGCGIDPRDDLVGIVQDQCVRKLIEDASQYLGVLPAHAELCHTPRKTHCMCSEAEEDTQNGSIHAMRALGMGKKSPTSRDQAWNSPDSSMIPTIDLLALGLLKPPLGKASCRPRNPPGAPVPLLERCGRAGFAPDKEKMHCRSQASLPRADGRRTAV